MNDLKKEELTKKTKTANTNKKIKTFEIKNYVKLIKLVGEKVDCSITLSITSKKLPIQKTEMAKTRITRKCLILTRFLENDLGVL